MEGIGAYGAFWRLFTSSSGGRRSAGGRRGLGVGGLTILGLAAFLALLLILLRSYRRVGMRFDQLAARCYDLIIRGLRVNIGDGAESWVVVVD